MKLELIQPALPKYLKKKPEKWIAPPLGLAIVAALTDAECSITDEAIEAIDFNKDVDLVGIRTVTATAPHAYEIADTFRARGTKVVLGGPHPTLCPEEASQHADAVVIGEAEGVWGQLIRDFKAGKLEQIYHTNEPPSLVNLPLPRRDLFKKDKYMVTNLLFATRGCPYSCSFCSIKPLWGHTFRTRPISDVLREVETLEGEMIFFIDDNLIGNLNFAKELFRALVPYKKKWFCQASINVAKDEELLRLAAESGCFAMAIGFESLSPASLAYINKKMNVVEEYEEAVRRIHSYGIAIQGSFIFGFDEDDSRVFETVLRFTQKVGLETACFAPLTPYPGTPLFNSLKREGRILNLDWSNYADIEGGVNFEPRLMSHQELEEGLNWTWRRFYSLPSIWKRLRRPRPNLWKFWLVNLGVRYYSSSLGVKLPLLAKLFGLFLRWAKGE